MIFMKIVIVDDHPVVRAGMRAVLEAATEIEVAEEFERPEDVLPWLRAHQVDLVLMDLRFGRATDRPATSTRAMDGTDGIRAVRKLKGPPVLVVTTYGSDPEILGALAAGAVGYVLKDCSTEELREAIFAGVQGERFLGAGVRSRVEKRSYKREVNLTGREVEVLRLAAAGEPNAQIADQLFISAATVKTHLNRAYEKLGVRSRTAAVAAARAKGALEE